MSDQTNLKTIDKLSVSDFGRLMLSKNDDGAFRSFGVRYENGIIWTNDEDWYKAWSSGQVVPGSIKIAQVQRRTYQTNDAGERVKINGRDVLIDVTDEMVEADPTRFPATWQWEITALKTMKMLEGENEMKKKIEEMEDNEKVRKISRTYDIQRKKLDIISEYRKSAVKAAETAELSEDQKAKLDAMLVDIEEE